MNNYGTNMGKENTFGDVNIKNKTVINNNSDKRKVVISITVVAVVIVAFLIGIVTVMNKDNITGKWTTEDGEYIEFLSDGTINYGDEPTSLHPDTYEILDEGYLKIGVYDAGWVEYSYTYWDFELTGDKLILRMKENADRVLVLTKE